MRYFFRFFILGLLLISSQALAQEDWPEKFDAAWRLVDERYWDKDHNGLDWDLMREQYGPKALAASNEEGFYRVLDEMYQELGDNHSRYVSPSRVEEFRNIYGDLPCVGVFAQQLTDLHSLGSIKYKLLENRVGYIHLPDLVSDGVTGNMRRAIEQLEAQEAERLIVDLRGNPGGRLFEMMRIAGLFTRGFLWRTVTRWTLPLPYPALGEVVTDLPLVLLVDAEVHSAAEGLAGALQASQRATLIGETTAGNVEAVLPFCFRDGSQAWIASGVLAPLLGPTWEGRGVVPDINTTSQDALQEALDFFNQSDAN